MSRISARCSCFIPFDIRFNRCEVRLGGHSNRRVMQRHGSVIGMMAVLLPVLAILAVVSINLAHIQVTRTELMVATDAAARAGSRALSETQNVNSAKTIATNVAAMNFVGDQPLILNRSDRAGDIQFGITTQPAGPNGRFEFQQVPTSLVRNGQAAASAFRVLGRRDDTSVSGRVPLAIPGVLNQRDFSTRQEAVAMQVDRDIALVLDRSGSMQNIDFDFPRENNPFSRDALEAGVRAGLIDRRGRSYAFARNVTQNMYLIFAWEEHFRLGPSPPSPWENLLSAVDAFLEVLNTTVQDEQVSIASYSTRATLDAHLTDNFRNVRGTIRGLDTGGRTAIGSGMNEGIETLLDNRARPFAARTMVVMTDGVHNQGVTPVTVARRLMSQFNLTIHTVTFSRGADQARMREVARIGNGNHYHADSATELIQVFQEIANNLPTILTR